LLRNSDRNYNHKQKVLTYIASKQHRIAERRDEGAQNGRVKRKLRRKKKIEEEEEEEEQHS
jgi:hypothetical protein